jgi:hypothetical protein
VSIVTSRAQRRELERTNAKMPLHLQEVPRDEWPPTMGIARAAPCATRRSRHFLVQQFTAPGPTLCRLSILRTTLAGDRWQDGITWDEMQRLKNEAGFGDCWAVEVFPADDEVVNVANIRHLWLLPEAPAFAWRRPQDGGA